MKIISYSHDKIISYAHDQRSYNRSVVARISGLELELLLGDRPLVVDKDVPVLEEVRRLRSIEEKINGLGDVCTALRGLADVIESQVESMKSRISVSNNTEEV